MVLFQIKVCAELGLFDHEAMNCEQTLPVIRIAPRLSDCLWSRFVDIARATNWLVRLHCLSSDGMQLRCSVICEEGGTVPL